MASNQQGRASARRLLSRLSRIRREAKLLLLSRRLGWTLAAVLAALALVGLTDYALRLPAWVRAIALIAAIAGVGWAFVRYAWPAWRMHPTLTDLALRLEGGRPELKGRLASATDLAQSGSLDRRFENLVDTLSHDTLPDLMKRRPTILALGVCLIIVASIATFAALQPGNAKLGVTRVLAPWSAAMWPSRTAIELASLPEFHPLGDPIAVRGLLTRTDKPVGRTRVEAWYRLDGGAPQKLALTSQGAPANDDGPEVFERLVNPAAEALRQTQRVTFETWLQTRDDRTESVTVELVRPPRVTRASARVRPPEYARDATAARIIGLGRQANIVPLALDSEDTASLGPVLQGSAIEFELRYSTAAEPSFSIASAAEERDASGISVEPMPDGLGSV
ncbi:MAG: hypothetical protein AAFV77_09230, partial [Planctomycetota bacterium]